MAFVCIFYEKSDILLPALTALTGDADYWR